MDKKKIVEFRELSRVLERNFEMINKSDCCLGNITSAQCHALVEIGRNPDLILKDLAVVLRVDVSTTSKVVEELVKKKLVSRTPSVNDRRSVDINLTKEGNALFNKIENDMNKIYAEIFSEIEENERESLLRSIQNYNRAIETVLSIK